MEITCYRGVETAREARALPAAVYNQAVILLAKNQPGCLFVPIRSMQYLAILDAEEFIFVDGQRKRQIDIAWRNFQPQLRTSLDAPVAYEAVYYCLDGTDLMRRLQVEFPPALFGLAGKTRQAGAAHVLKFPAPGK